MTDRTRETDSVALWNIEQLLFRIECATRGEFDTETAYIVRLKGEIYDIRRAIENYRVNGEQIK